MSKMQMGPGNRVHIKNPKTYERKYKAINHKDPNQLGPQGRKVCITVAPSPLCRQPYFTHPAGARKPHSHVGMAG